MTTPLSARGHRPLCALVCASLGVSLLTVSAPAQSQRAYSGIDPSLISLETALTAVELQREVVKEQIVTPATVTTTTTATPDRTLKKEGLEEKLLQIQKEREQLLKQQPTSPSTTVTTTPTTLTDLEKKKKEAIELMQTLVEKMEEIRTTTGGASRTDSPARAETSSSSSSATLAPKQELAQLAAAAVGDTSAPVLDKKPDTTSEVAQHIAVGQGNLAMLSQVVTPVAVSSVSPPPVTLARNGVAASPAATATAQALEKTIVTTPDASAAVMLAALDQSLQQHGGANVAAPLSTTPAQLQSYSYVTANIITPASQYPSRLLAVYNGVVNGRLNGFTTLTGTMQAIVNFTTLQSGAQSIQGTMDFGGGQGTSFGLAWTSGGYASGTMNGTLQGTSVSGPISMVQFFGPDAAQMGGSWSVIGGNGTVGANGTFKAAR